MKTGTSVDYDNRAKCYIRIVFLCKCLTQSISEKDNFSRRQNFSNTAVKSCGHIAYNVATHPVGNF